MNEMKVFKRSPTIQCWIKHILEGQYDDNEKFFYTIFGHVKRIRIIATVIDKNEKLVEINDTDIGIEENADTNIRIDFDLDDSTGIIRAIKTNIDPENFKQFKKGDIVEVIGRVSKWGDYCSLWIEIMRNVEDPNLILLRNAEIIEKMKHGEIQEIPEIEDLSDNFDDFSEEIDAKTLFESEDDSDKHNELKKKIYLVVEEYSAKGTGITFEKLQKAVKIPNNQLRSILNDLILESRIYESDNDNFETF
ncbi:MAG: hypothetical protein ACFFEY_14370 [Candidatus Thorarchaeota archaeon]